MSRWRMAGLLYSGSVTKKFLDKSRVTAAAAPRDLGSCGNDRGWDTSADASRIYGFRTLAVVGFWGERKSLNLDPLNHSAKICGGPAKSDGLGQA